MKFVILSYSKFITGGKIYETVSKDIPYSYKDDDGNVRPLDSYKYKKID